MACSYLIDQALMKIWAGPRQDTQSIVKPMRITPQFGVWNKVDVQSDTYILPESGVRFHVYQIGQLYPLLMGLFPIQDSWETLASNCNKQNMVINIYNTKGIELPLFESWYLVTPNRNLLIAIKEQEVVDIDLKIEPIYMRVYSGAYFQGNRFQSQNDYIKVVSKRIASNEDIANMKDEYEKVRIPNMNLPLLYINGRKSNILNFNTVQKNDVVEWVEDTSIYRYIEFPIRDLKTFDSIKDLKRKYLLHYATPFQSSDQLDYHDDIDFFIVRTDPNNLNPAYSGFYYHRNQEDSVRNITHRDYSICIPYVTRYTEQEIPLYNDNKSDTGWVIQMYVRHSGWDRPLQSIHNRVKELYKLPDRNIVQAFLGIHSLVNEWRADNLENSDYMSVMANHDYNLDQTITENAWGYNAVSKMVADTPSKVEIFSGQKTIKAPVMLRRYATGFEYDKNGVLLGYHSHIAGDRYVCRDEESELVELISGYGSDYLDETYNQVYSHYDPDFNYRLYKQEKNRHDGIMKWEVAIDGKDYVLDKDKNYFKCLLDLNNWNFIVRSDKNILVMERKHFMQDGLIYFPIKYNASRTGVAQSYTLDIPLGELDVFLNGYSLVEDVDYYVDYPNICIVNKKFLIDQDNQDQSVIVRAYAFPEKDPFSRNEKEEAGFVQYGTLSRNNKFDIRDDRVMRINVAGRVIHRDDLGFSENDSEIHVQNVPSGSPYEIKDIIVQFRNIVQQDHYTYRLRSLELNDKISDYMSQFIKDKPETLPDPIPSYWPVFSPFCVKVLFDLKDGVLDNKPIREFYDDNFVVSYTNKYRYLLNVDPTQDNTLYHDEFVKVHPTHLNKVIDLDPWQYKFMERVVKLILKNRVDLTQFARIKQ